MWLKFWERRDIKTGIYRIINRNNGKVYVGSTTRSFIERWREHREALKAGKHQNGLLQADWIKHGERAFKFEVCEVIVDDVMRLMEREQYWMAAQVNKDRLYNRSANVSRGRSRNSRYFIPYEPKNPCTIEELLDWVLLVKRSDNGGEFRYLEIERIAKLTSQPIELVMLRADEIRTVQRSF